MKKFFVIFALVIFSLSFTSCNQSSNTTTTVTTETTITPEPDLTGGFYVKTQVVIKGNTLWGISKQNYGSGLKWRDIVKQNPFLDAPGRIYYDQSKKIWVALIYPGETLKIGGEVITPTYVVKETTTTTTTTEQPTFVSIMPWWGWLLSLLALTGIITLFVLLFRNTNNPNTSTSTATANSTLHVNIRGAGIDLATQAAILTRRQDLDERAVAIAEKGETKNQLSYFGYSRTENGLDVNCEFFPPVAKPATETVPLQPAESKEEGK